MENKIETLLDEIESKVAKLNRRIQRLETENAELRSAVFDYIKQLDESKRKLHEADTQLKSLAIANKHSLNSKELKKELDKYILLIDRCIAALQTKL